MNDCLPPADQNLPSLQESRFQDGELTIALQVPANLSFFDGHFDSNPVVPGYVLVGWVKYFSEPHWPDLFHAGYRSPAMKFTSPVLPGDSLILKVSPVKPDKGLKFGYIRSGENSPCCSGEIRYPLQ